MFYLLYPLADVFTPFNLFRYLTFRSIAAFLTALVLSFLIGGGLIRWLRSKQKQGQPIRDDGPASHLVSKKGTPTMGGLLILITLTIATLLWADLTNPYVWIVLGVTLTFGVVGFLDDFLKVTKRNPKGVPGKMKLALSVVVAGAAAWLIAQSSPAPLRYMLALPFLKDVLLPLGVVGFVPFAVLVIVGASNAVNLTDGLDGLAIGPVIMAAAVFGLIAYVVGNPVLTTYLLPPPHPARRRARRFAVGAGRRGPGLPVVQRAARHGVHGRHRVACHRRRARRDRVVTKHELVLAIVGGLFVLETVSVIVQVLPSNGPAGASSAWRRCIIISSRRAGPSRPSSSASGSSPRSWRWPASPP